ncbi:MAG: CheR family methyltransferase, partial [Pseudomonadota bacterium]
AAVPARRPVSGDDAKALLRLRGYIAERWGVVFDDHQSATLKTRLQRRYRELGYRSLGEYCGMLFEQGGIEGERDIICDAVTTQTTSFFRESRHFDFLSENYLARGGGDRRFQARPLMAWSAASSIGQEAYTLAMVLAEHSRLHYPLEFEILATDISVGALHQVKDAVYPEQDISKLPSDLRARYFLRGKSDQANKVRVVSTLRSRVKPRRLNLVMPPYQDIANHFDLIMIRNCLIYFDAETRLRVVRALSSHLRQGGLLMTGHSEAFTADELGMEIVGPSLYRK